MSNTGPPCKQGGQEKTRHHWSHPRQNHHDSFCLTSAGIPEHTTRPSIAATTENDHTSLNVSAVTRRRHYITVMAASDRAGPAGLQPPLPPTRSQATRPLIHSDTHTPLRAVQNTQTTDRDGRSGFLSRLLGLLGPFRGLLGPAGAF